MSRIVYFRLIFIIFVLLTSLSCSASTPQEPSTHKVDEGAVVSALARLDAPRHRDRKAAQTALVRMKAGGPVAQTLRTRLGTAAHHAGTVALIHVLSRVGGSAAEQVLLETASRHKAHLNHRVEAVYALRRLHSPKTLPGLCRLAESEAPSLIRVAVLGALGDFTDSQAACRLLTRKLASGADRERIEAARCLLCFTSYDLRHAYLPKFFDRSWQVRILAVEHARRQPWDRSRKQLEITARHDRNLNVSLAAKRALKRLGLPEK